MSIPPSSCDTIVKRAKNPINIPPNHKSSFCSDLLSVPPEPNLLTLKLTMTQLIEKAMIAMTSSESFGIPPINNRPMKAAKNTPPQMSSFIEVATNPKRAFNPRAWGVPTAS